MTPGSAPTDDLTQWLERADPSRAPGPEQGAEAAHRAWELACAAGLHASAVKAVALRCGHLFRLGRLAQVREEAEASLATFDQAGDVHDRCEVLRLLALACCESGAFDVALDAARQLEALAAESCDADLALTAAYSLAACMDRLGDPWQSTRVLREAIAAFGYGGSPRQRLMVHIGLCAFLGDTYHRMRDAATAAERLDLLTQVREAADACLPLLPQVTEPVYAVVVLGNLGEAMTLQGELYDAEPLLREALQRARDCGLTAYRWRVQATQADWLLARGHATQAVATAEELLAEMGDTAPALTEIRARDVAYRAHQALGQHETALAHFAAFERLERRRTLTQLRAQSSVFVTRIEAENAMRQAQFARQEAARQMQRVKELARRAEQDPLTGLGNRAYFERRVAALGTLVRHDDPMRVLALLDIDHFKLINDRFGHAAGDHVLVGIAQMLLRCTREADIVARLGGDEFAVIIVGAPQRPPNDVFERLRRDIELAVGWTGLPADHRVMVSIGVAAAGDDEISGWMKRADDALYAAKRAGRNRVCAALP
jgi:diguanylate cyclase